ncbi:MAG: T9SS type A sorting domain-containing protein [Bacteroidales bacterium]|nr:T9SS type A sorting domain-containing protein [Bacteroidales bacterium]
MKKILSLAAAAIIALGAQAEDVKYLNFRTLDGQEASLSIAEGLTITFQDGKIVARAADSIFQTELSNMQDMYFSYQITDIKSITTDEIPEGAIVRIYTTDGHMVQSYQHTQGAQPQLPAGLYMIQAGGKTTKTLVK